MCVCVGGGVGEGGDELSQMQAFNNDSPKVSARAGLALDVWRP